MSGIQHILLGGGGGGEPPFPVNAVDFDATNDYVSRGAGFTGAVDGSLGIFSCWLRFDGGDGTSMDIFNSTNGTVSVRRYSANRFRIQFDDSAGTAIITAISLAGTDFTASATWHHLLIGWSTNFTAGNKLFKLYVNDVDLTPASLSADSASGLNVDYTVANWRVGAGTGVGEPNKFDGCMAELYFAPQYLDFSGSANRRKFISAGGKPVDLGSTGSLPTGTAPLVYMKNAAASFDTNSGTGGNFTITGTLDTASTSPSD